MQGVYLLSGTAVFPEDPKLTEKSVIRLILEDVTTVKLGAIRIAEKQVEFDPSDIAVFKYLNFDFREFDIDENGKYLLSMHVDKNGNGTIEEGDFITREIYSVVSGLEQFKMQVTRV